MSGAEPSAGGLASAAAEARGRPTVLTNPLPAVPMTEEETVLEQLPRFRTYVESLEAALATFEKAKEWADLIKSLQGLTKVLAARQFEGIPVLPSAVAVTTGKRLAQCLNPGLPDGVHIKTLDVCKSKKCAARGTRRAADAGSPPPRFAAADELLLTRVGPERMLADLPIYTAGLFPLLSHSSSRVQPRLLRLYEKFLLPLGPRLLPALSGLVLALLPGLEEDKGDHFRRVLALLGRVQAACGTRPTMLALWRCLLFCPRMRLSVLNYMTACLPAGPPEQLARCLPVAPFEGLVVEALLATFRDSGVLVRRRAMELLLTHFPLTPYASGDGSAAALPRAQAVRLVAGVLLLLPQAEVSLVRRIDAWLGARGRYDASGTAVSRPESASPPPSAAAARPLAGGGPPVMDGPGLGDAPPSDGDGNDDDDEVVAADGVASAPGDDDGTGGADAGRRGADTAGDEDEAGSPRAASGDESNHGTLSDALLALLADGFGELLGTCAGARPYSYLVPGNPYGSSEDPEPEPPSSAALATAPFEVLQLVRRRSFVPVRELMRRLHCQLIEFLHDYHRGVGRRSEAARGQLLAPASSAGRADAPKEAGTGAAAGGTPVRRPVLRRREQQGFALGQGLGFAALLPTFNFSWFGGRQPAHHHPAAAGGGAGAGAGAGTGTGGAGAGGGGGADDDGGGGAVSQPAWSRSGAAAAQAQAAADEALQLEMRRVEEDFRVLRAANALYVDIDVADAWTALEERLGAAAARCRSGAPLGPDELEGVGRSVVDVEFALDFLPVRQRAEDAEADDDGAEDEGEQMCGPGDCGGGEGEAALRTKDRLRVGAVARVWQVLVWDVVQVAQSAWEQSGPVPSAAFLLGLLRLGCKVGERLVRMRRRPVADPPLFDGLLRALRAHAASMARPGGGGAGGAAGGERRTQWPASSGRSDDAALMRALLDLLVLLADAPGGAETAVAAEEKGELACRLFRDVSGLIESSVADVACLAIGCWLRLRGGVGLGAGASVGRVLSRLWQLVAPAAAPAPSVAGAAGQPAWSAPGALSYVPHEVAFLFLEAAGLAPVPVELFLAERAADVGGNEDDGGGGVSVAGAGAAAAAASAAATAADPSAAADVASRLASLWLMSCDLERRPPDGVVRLVVPLAGALTDLRLPVQLVAKQWLSEALARGLVAQVLDPLLLVLLDPQTAFRGRSVELVVSEPPLDGRRLLRAVGLVRAVVAADATLVAGAAVSDAGPWRGGGSMDSAAQLQALSGGDTRPGEGAAPAGEAGPTAPAAASGTTRSDAASAELVDGQEELGQEQEDDDAPTEGAAEGPDDAAQPAAPGAEAAGPRSLWCDWDYPLVGASARSCAEVLAVALYRLVVARPPASEPLVAQLSRVRSTAAAALLELLQGTRRHPGGSTASGLRLFALLWPALVAALKRAAELGDFEMQLLVLPLLDAAAGGLAADPELAGRHFADESLAEAVRTGLRGACARALLEGPAATEAAVTLRAWQRAMSSVLPHSAAALPRLTRVLAETYASEARLVCRSARAGTASDGQAIALLHVLVVLLEGVRDVIHFSVLGPGSTVPPLFLSVDPAVAAVSESAASPVATSGAALASPANGTASPPLQVQQPTTAGATTSATTTTAPSLSLSVDAVPSSSSKSPPPVVPQVGALAPAPTTAGEGEGGGSRRVFASALRLVAPVKPLRLTPRSDGGGALTVAASEPIAAAQATAGVSPKDAALAVLPLATAAVVRAWERACWSLEHQQRQLASGSLTQATSARAVASACREVRRAAASFLGPLVQFQPDKAVLAVLILWERDFVFPLRRAAALLDTRGPAAGAAALEPERPLAVSSRSQAATLSLLGGLPGVAPGLVMGAAVPLVRAVRELERCGPHRGPGAVGAGVGAALATVAGAAGGAAGAAGAPSLLQGQAPVLADLPGARLVHAPHLSEASLMHFLHWFVVTYRAPTVASGAGAGLAGGAGGPGSAMRPPPTPEEQEDDAAADQQPALLGAWGALQVLALDSLASADTSPLSVLWALGVVYQFSHRCGLAQADSITGRRVRREMQELVQQLLVAAAGLVTGASLYAPADSPGVPGGEGLTPVPPAAAHAPPPPPDEDETFLPPPAPWLLDVWADRRLSRFAFGDDGDRGGGAAGSGGGGDGEPFSRPRVGGSRMPWGASGPPPVAASWPSPPAGPGVPPSPSYSTLHASAATATATAAADSGALGDSSAHVGGVLPVPTTFARHASPGRVSALAVRVLANCLAPLLAHVWRGEPDAALAVLGQVVPLLFGGLRDRSRWSKAVGVGVAAVFSSLSVGQHRYAFPSWRRAAWAHFLGPDFFRARADALEQWRWVVSRVVSEDKAVLTEVLDLVAAPGVVSGLGRIFSADAGADAARRRSGLRRLGFLLHSGRPDQFSRYLTGIVDNLVASFKLPRSAPGVAELHAETFFVFRVLLARMSPSSLAPVWPLLVTEIVRVLQSRRSEPFLVLAACKLLDLAAVLLPAHFHIYHWVFALDCLATHVAPADLRPDTGPPRPPASASPAEMDSAPDGALDSGSESDFEQGRRRLQLPQHQPAGVAGEPTAAPERGVFDMSPSAAAAAAAAGSATGGSSGGGPDALPSPAAGFGTPGELEQAMAAGAAAGTAPSGADWNLVDGARVTDPDPAPAVLAAPTARKGVALSLSDVEDGFGGGAASAQQGSAAPSPHVPRHVRLARLLDISFNPYLLRFEVRGGFVRPESDLLPQPPPAAPAGFPAGGNAAAHLPERELLRRPLLLQRELHSAGELATFHSHLRLLSSAVSRGEGVPFLGLPDLPFIDRWLLEDFAEKNDDST